MDLHLQPPAPHLPALNQREAARRLRRASSLVLRGCLVGLAALGLGLPARAGSATAESTWDRSNARSMAMEQVPRGARVTQVSCTEIGMSGNNFRYRCTVYYDNQPPVSPQP